MSIKPYESVLAQKNYRGNWTGAVTALTNVTQINPILEKLTDPETFNTRFQQLSQGIRHTMNAAADIALRDKKHLESFLSGHTNPIVTEEFAYDDPSIYTNIPAFNLNGNPINYSEDRIMYSVTTLGTLSMTSTYAWVFKNGLLLDESFYDIVNTAYGVKCFVKASIIAPEDTINIVINKIFNPYPKDSRQTVKLVSPKTSVTYVFPVNLFGKFYHTDYLRVYVKRNTKYILVPFDRIIKELDVTGTNIKITIKNFQMLADDSIEVYNSIYLYKYTEKRKIVANKPWKRDIVLSDTFDTDDIRPVPVGSAHDFDIFVNGYQLIPELHYGVIDNTDISFGFPILRFYFDVPNGKEIDLKIFKNESVPRDSVNMSFFDVLSEKGLIIREQLDWYVPYMVNLGHCFIAGKYVSNNKLTHIQRNIIRVNDNVNAKREFCYQTRIVYSYDTKELVDYAKSNINEYDQVLNLVGDDFIKQKLDNDPNSNPIIPDDNFKNKVFKEFGSENGFIFSGSKGLTDSSNLKKYLTTRISNIGPIILNSNTYLNKNMELKNYFSVNLILDANIYTSPEAEIYDVNL